MKISDYVKQEAIVNEITEEDMRERLILYGIMAYKTIRFEKEFQLGENESRTDYRDDVGSHSKRVDISGSEEDGVISLKSRYP